MDVIEVQEMLEKYEAYQTEKALYLIDKYNLSIDEAIEIVYNEDR